MSLNKRKRLSEGVKRVFSPDDVKSRLEKVGRESSSLSFMSSDKSWKKCGDSFVDVPEIKNLKSSGKKLSAIKKWSQPAAIAQTGVQCNEDAVHIAWSSSDSEQADDETQEQHLSRGEARQPQRPRRPGRPTAPIHFYTKALHMLSTDKDDLPAIDTDSDLDEYEEHVEDSGQQISDCESEPFDEKADLSLNPTNVTDLEISDHASDEENVGHLMTSSRLDSESLPLCTGEGSTRSVSDWVRSAQVMLQTPQKHISRQPKTPEDSAKKKRKFHSGGLAERLNRLQCRQRSAVSFWRHQSTSDTSTVDRPGVLVLEVLEVQQEGSMQLAHCEHHQPPTEGRQHKNPVSEERAHMLVLFNRETAAHLIPTPRDIIHIFPPWQTLSIEGFSCDIILNTHFSQKIYSASKPANMLTPRGLLSAQCCNPYSLCKTFGLLEVCRATEGNNAEHAAAFSALCSFGESGVLTRHCLSLLEAIEGLGQAGSVGQDVEVVVQRVYSIPVPDCSPMSIIKPRGPSRTSSAPPPAEKGKTRLCMLVQDAYGMFSVVQLHLLPAKDDLHRYCRLWQGRSCVLRGVKVVQRVTRERRSRLFSLIDSLWPPVTPLRDHGNTPSMSSDSRPAGPAPSFCYLLSGQESSVERVEELAEPPLYLPPSRQTLRDILRNELQTRRCSFTATVIYKKILQCSDAGQVEAWLVLTDTSLQEEQSEEPCRRTVALCVNTSCVLTSSVFDALKSSAACRMSFRDAIKECGVLLCGEQSVVELDPDGSAECPDRPESDSLSQHVRLDPLSPEITPNSLCSLTGMIVGVDENSAYSWPSCNHCGSDNLEILAGRPENFHCASCKSVVDKPDTRIQMEVFLSSSFRDCTLKVKLHQKTIMSILNTAALEGNEFSGYDVESILGKEVGPLAVYARVVTRKPALWMGLEEICL